MSRELKRGGQVFFVHNRVKDIEEQASMILRLVPDARITYVHGQMDGDLLEKRMMKFVDGDYDVLVTHHPHRDRASTLPTPTPSSSTAPTCTA